MSTTVTNPGIKNSWSLISFAAGKQMKLASLKGENGEFKSVVFIDGSNYTFVSFSSKLGELSAREIVAQKDQLQVVELNSGTYKLCRRGEGNAWEDIVL